MSAGQIACHQQKCKLYKCKQLQ